MVYGCGHSENVVKKTKVGFAQPLSLSKGKDCLRRDECDEKKNRR